MKPGVLIISHGSPDAAWIQLVDESVAKLDLPAEMPVAASFLEVVEGRLIQDGIDLLEEEAVTDLIVIPLFVSSGSTHIDEIAYALGVKASPEKETDLEPFRLRARVHFGEPVDDDPIIAQMIWDKIRALSAERENEVILLVGHGSVHDGFRQRWERGISSLAEHVREVGRVKYADYALLNPDSTRDKVKYWHEERGMDVLVAPLFLSGGYFTKKAIPARLEGLTYRYSGEALLPHPKLNDWIRSQILTIMKLLTLS